LQIDREDLRRHYAALSDEELLDLDPNDLTEVALECYEKEMQHRHLTEAPEGDEPDESELEEHHAETDTDWLETAALACSFSTAQEAGHAHDVLAAAGIPCEMSELEPDPGGNGNRFPEYQVMVPSPLILKATAILDRDIFNVEQEATWKTHFEALSDGELRALNPASICLGLLDKVDRLKRTYREEMERRGLR
jgi:hypothetical protein